MVSHKCKVTVSGDVRRAAAIVEATPIGLVQKGDDLVGNGDVEVEGDTVYVAVTLFGQADAAFQIVVGLEDSDGETKSAKKKGKMKNDVAIRAYEIPLKDFEGDDE